MTYKLGELIRKGYLQFESSRKYSNSRKEAHAFRKEVIKRKRRSFVDRKIREEIREYAKNQFGSAEYWPWLALYAEVREQFIEGWIPEDYYALDLLPKINPQPMAMVSTAKSLDYRLFSDFAIRPLGVRVSGQFFDAAHNPLKDEAFLKLLQDYNSEAVIKRDGAPSGGGIVFKQSREIQMDDFESRYNYVIQPSVKQHESLSRLYGSSVNTLRITTLMTSGTVSVLHRSLRFGTGGSRAVYTASGERFIFLGEDGESLSNAYDDLGFEIGDRHSDSGFIFKDIKVPSVPEAVQKCKTAHLRFPYLKFIAWDVYIDENGNPGMIEWNARKPDMWTNEALIGPLWPEEIRTGISDVRFEI